MNITYHVNTEIQTYFVFGFIEKYLYNTHVKDEQNILRSGMTFSI